MKSLRIAIVVGYFLCALLPLAWLGLTSLKSQPEAISIPAKLVPVPFAPTDPNGIVFQPVPDSYTNLGHPLVGVNQSFYAYLLNSVLIGALSAVAAVALGTTCAYGFSRFRIAGAQDWLFFILSTRFLPPLAVVVPILLMYRQIDLQNTHAGLILLYTTFNLSLAVWLMKGFIDEIPKAYEEAALIDGYTHLSIFWRIILPRALTGMAVTGVFCLISAWNEYAFALTLNSANAVTAPVYFAGLQGNIQGVPWPQIAAGVLVFVIPIVVFTVLVRHHLLRGVTFGAIKQ